MSQRHYVLASLLAVILSVAGVWLASSAPGHAAGSALSLDHDGWLAARRYLESRGARVSLLDDPARRREACWPSSSRGSASIRTAD